MAAKSPLGANVAAQRLTDKEILAILADAERDAMVMINRLPKKPKVGAATRAMQVRMRRRMIEAWRQVGDVTEKGIARAVRQATASYSAADAKILRKLGINPNEYLKQMRQEAENSIKVLQAKKLNNISLSQRVYRNGAVTSGQVNKIVNNGLALGKSAAEIAGDVKKYVNPQTPGGVRYAANRLARTEINNAFHATAIQRYKDNPFVDYVKWSLSGSHPRPDDCNDYAESSHTNPDKGAGVWATDDVPARPHPNCLCYLEPISIDEDDFLAKMRNGEYDDFIG